MARVLERGEIRFRPIADVDGEPRYHVRIRPAEKRVERDLVFGRRALAAAGGREQAWALVDAVGERLPDEEAAMRGVYVVVAHGEHTHLAFALDEDGRAAAARLPARASYLVTVKNPDPRGRVGAPRAAFPPALRERFCGGARLVPLDPPDFLDHVGAELVLLGAPEDAWEELGIPLDPHTPAPP